MRRRITMTLSALCVGLFATFAPAQVGGNSVQSEIESIRADMATLKDEVQQAVDQYQLSTSAADADAQQPAAPVDPEVAKRIEALVQHQQQLEQRIDDLIDSQRKLEDAVVRSERVAVDAVRSPFDYRYQDQTAATTTTTTVTTTRTQQPAPPANATYTTYDNGYQSATYVRPTVVAKTASPVVHAPVRNVYYNSYPRVYRPYRGHYYGHYRWPHYRHYGHYHRKYHHYSGVSVGVKTGNVYFRYGTALGGWCW